MCAGVGGGALHQELYKKDLKFRLKRGVNNNDPEFLTPRKRPFFAVSDFGNLGNTQNLRVVYRLHHLKMRIFKLSEEQQKSRRYVISRIYGFFISYKNMHICSARGTNQGYPMHFPSPDSGSASSEKCPTVRQKTLWGFGVLRILGCFGVVSGV